MNSRWIWVIKHPIDIHFCLNTIRHRIHEKCHNATGSREIPVRWRSEWSCGGPDTASGYIQFRNSKYRTRWTQWQKIWVNWTHFHTLNKLEGDAYASHSMISAFECRQKIALKLVCNLISMEIIIMHHCGWKRHLHYQITQQTSSRMRIFWSIWRFICLFKVKHPPFGGMAN